MDKDDKTHKELFHSEPSVANPDETRSRDTSHAIPRSCEDKHASYAANGNLLRQRGATPRMVTMREVELDDAFRGELKGLLAEPARILWSHFS